MAAHSNTGENLMLDAANAIHFLWNDNEKFVKVCRELEITNLKLIKENEELKAEIKSTRKAYES